jgi:hypothetical protein
VIELGKFILHGEAKDVASNDRVAKELSGVCGRRPGAAVVFEVFLHWIASLTLAMTKALEEHRASRHCEERERRSNPALLSTMPSPDYG